MELIGNRFLTLRALGRIASASGFVEAHSAPLTAGFHAFSGAIRGAESVIY